MTDLSYFVGKCCTIITRTMNRNFKEENPMNFPEPVFTYFIGYVEKIEEDGVWLAQLSSGLKSFFFKHSIIAISEEEVKTEEEKFEEVPNLIFEDKPLDLDSLSSKISNLKQKYT